MDPEKPFLVETNKEPGKYLTLSYKWGDSAKYLTEINNYLDHLKEIPLISADFD